jgi:environmental stress-induced protein Ves
MPPRITQLRASQFKRSLWKNGLGWTDQIAISPETADLRRADFDWRLSSARIEQGSDFSPFPEHDRILVVIEGAGLRLAHAGHPGPVELPPGEAYEFSGDVPTRCELIDGPVRDFSVFLRKGRVSGLVEGAAISGDSPLEWDPQGETAFAFCLSGSFAVGGLQVAAGDAIRIDLGEAGDELAEPVVLTSRSAQVMLVQLHSA